MTITKCRPPRPRALPILTVLGMLVAFGALLSIIAMTAAAAVPPNIQAALERQQRLAAERPQDAAVLNDLGNLLVMAGEPSEAEAAYRRAVEVDPHRLSAQYNLGLLLLQRGKTGEARQLFEKVIEIEPRHAWAHYQLGALLERKGDRSRAVREYAQAFRLDPQLAFREVNPQIVENGMVTESLLLAYRRQSSASAAPPIYDERSRIRELLVQEPGQPGKDAAADAKAAAPPAAAPGGKATVLRPGDLSGSSSLGQATSPGSRPGGPVVAGRPPYGAPNYVPQQDSGAYQPGAKQWTRPAPNPNVDGTQPGTVVTPPPVGLYYRPSPSSTGRLGTQVVPEENG